MKIRLAKSNRGSFIGILVAVLLLLLALFLIVYLLLALFRVPVRAFPKEADELYAPYLFEPITDVGKRSPLRAPEGMQVRKAPLLASTNLVNWDTVFCEVDAAGYLHAPDGAVLQLHGDWNEEAYEWQALYPVIVRGGENGMMFFRLP